MSPATNGWNRWQKLIIFRLDKQDEKMDKHSQKLDKIEGQLVGLKIKVAGIAAATGVLTGMLFHSFKG